MKAHQTKIYRYGVSQVESALASDAPDPLPRRDLTSTTSRTVRGKRKTGLSNRTAKQTLLVSKKSTIWFSNRKFVIYNVYNHPGTNFIIPPTLNENDYQNTVIVGDFNRHCPSWGYDSYNETGRNIEELANTSNLFIVQDSNSPATLLHRAHKTLFRPDLSLLSSDLSENYQSEVTEMIGNSDHRPILTKILLPKQNLSAGLDGTSKKPAGANTKKHQINCSMKLT